MTTLPMHAFPVVTFEQISLGMTLRDYFAGQALAGMIPDFTPPVTAARTAYAIADAMLMARGESAAKAQFGEGNDRPPAARGD